jgi:hypothetical protein
MDWTREDDHRFAQDVRDKRAGLPRRDWAVNPFPPGWKPTIDWSKRDPVPGFNPNAPKPSTPLVDEIERRMKDPAEWLKPSSGVTYGDRWPRRDNSDFRPMDEPRDEDVPF